MQNHKQRRRVQLDGIHSRHTKGANNLQGQQGGMGKALAVGIGIALFIAWGIVGHMDMETEKLEAQPKPSMMYVPSDYTPDAAPTIYEN